MTNDKTPEEICDEAIPTLTDKERRRLEEWLCAHPYGEQDENGIDLSLIRKNLKLTPAQRLSLLQQAHDSFIKLANGRFAN